MQRHIDIHNDERDRVIKKNTRNLIIGIGIFILLIIIMARSGAGKDVLTVELIFMVSILLK